MKNFTLTLVFTPILLLASSDGYEVYKKNCSTCHIETISKNEFVKNISTMKAPPMIEVSNQLKNQIMIKNDDEDVHKKVVVLFIKNYIDNPNLEYSLCNPPAIERFGVMPSKKGKLNDEEKEAVAEWIYDRYEGVQFK
ncbi:cytochrome c [Sulfurimonas sp.]|uniref:c-type cytochrome n=1 Tax=Sulfurimonas sp. TaxID=2022749 RepID=UPI00356981E3